MRSSVWMQVAVRSCLVYTRLVELVARYSERGRALSSENMV